MSEPTFVEKADPEEAFTALSDDTRVAILQALWEADGHRLSFSELRDAVGMRDSGQFNYHLSRLVGLFVAKTDGEYELTQAGMGINGTIEAGSYTMAASIEPIDLDTGCPTCDGNRILHYEDETVQVTCDSCTTRFEFGVPPAAFAGYDRAAIPEVASRYLRATFQHIGAGFCPHCDGRLRSTVYRADELNPVDEPPDDISEELLDRLRKIPMVQYDCQQCGATPTGGLDLAFLDHPAVTCFYYEHGIDVTERSLWELSGLDPDNQTLRSEDPFRASVTYEVDGDALTVVTDENLNVVDVER